MRILLTAIFSLFLLTMAGQQKPQYSTQNSVGVLIGEHDTAPLLESVNGLVYRNWFAGVGTGIDWHYSRSIPLFFSGARFIPVKTGKQLQLSSGIGINFPWAQSDTYFGWYSTAPTYKNGLYWNAGMGYRIGVGKKNDALLVHLGYINKSYTQVIKTVMPCLIPPCPESVESYKYSLNALSVKLGWGF